MASSILIPGVRTAGSKTNLQRMLGERAWQFGTSADENARSIAVDSSGNTYVAGNTPGAFSGNAGGQDAFIAKYNSSGTQEWVKQFGTFANGIAVDSSGNTYISGTIYGTFANNTSVGLNDAFIAKYNSSGTQVWVKQFGTILGDFGFGITADSSGNFYITGYTFGEFAGNTSSGNADAFVAKYNSSGTQDWVKQFGTNSDDYGNGIASDSSGNLFITGITTGAFAGFTNAGLLDAFLMRLDVLTNTYRW